MFDKHKYSFNLNQHFNNFLDCSNKTDGPTHEGTAFSDGELDDTHIKPPVVWRRRERTNDPSNKRTLLTRTPHITSEPITATRLMRGLRVSNTEPAPE